MDSLWNRGERQLGNGISFLLQGSYWQPIFCFVWAAQQGHAVQTIFVFVSSFFFQCQCCQTDVGTIQDTLPDVSIAYKLHLECGRMINLYDWLQVRTFCRFVTCKVVFQNQAKCLCSYWLMTREFVYRNSGVFRCTKSGHCQRIVEGLSKEEENDDLRWRNTVSFGWWPLFVHHGLFPSPHLVVAACIKATRVGLKCVYVHFGH